MATYKNGQWLKWTSSDDDGPFSHTGVVSACNDKMVILDTPVGMISCNVDGDGTFTEVKKPKNAPSTVETVVLPSLPSPAATNGLKPLSECSDRVKESVSVVMTAGPGLTRKAYIEALVEQIGMTTASASTFYNTAKKYV
jgi:hypothetical protein